MATELECPKCGGIFMLTNPEDYPKSHYECWDCGYCILAVKVLDHDIPTYGAGWEPSMDPHNEWWSEADE